MSIINLLPQDYLKRRMQRRMNVLCSGLFAMVMIAVLAAVAVSDRSIRNTEEVARRVNASYEEASNMLEQLNQLQAQRKKMLAKAEMTSQLLERIPRSTILAVITNSIPAHASLISYDMTTETIIARSAAAPSGSSKARKGNSKLIAQEAMGTAENTVTIITLVELEGLAGTDVDVARFIANLAINPLTKSVDLLFSQEEMIADMTCRKFRIRMELRENIDAREVVNYTVTNGPEEIDTGLKGVSL